MENTGIMMLFRSCPTFVTDTKIAGSVCMLGAKVKEESTVATLLRAAGAVILGKTNLSEWAACRSGGNASASQGWSAHGGMTYGAYCEKQSPSGSSSGSAVAASVGLALAAIGTEVSGICLLMLSFPFTITL